MTASISVFARSFVLAAVTVIACQFVDAEPYYELIGNQTGPFSVPHNLNYWSFYEDALWAGFKVPGVDYPDGDDDTDDEALLGTGYDPPGTTPPYDLSNGGTLYFGDFENFTN